MDRRYKSAPKISGHINNLLEFINLVINNIKKQESVMSLLEEAIVNDQIEFMRKKAYAKPPEIERYGTLSLIKTDELINEIEMKYDTKYDDLPEYFGRRKESLVFSPKYTAKKSKKSFRTDPYAGMLAFFDYCFSRIGTVRQRRYNLVFRPKGISYNVMEKMYKNYWKNKCPFGLDELDNIPLMTLHLREGCRYTKNKQLRIFGYLSDMMIFDDFVLYG